MKQGDVLGRKKHSEKYGYGKDSIVKLYRPSVPKEIIELEYNKCKIIHDTNISSPKVMKIVKVENRFGLVFEKIHGDSMLRILEDEPQKIDKYAEILAVYHVGIHNELTTELIDQVEFFARKIKSSKEIDNNIKDRLLKYLEKMPTANSICHGDYNPDNIILSGEKVNIIEWSNSYKGHPASDFARTMIILTSPNAPAEASDLFRKLLRISKQKFAEKYKTEFMNMSGILEDELQMWMPIAATVRLSENNEDEKAWLLKIIEKGLKEMGL